MDTSIADRIVTYGGSPCTLATPTTKEVITDATRSSPRVNWTPRYVRRTGRDGSTRGDTCIDISYPWDNSPVLILGTTMYPSCGIGGRFQVGNKQQSTSPDKIRNTQKWILLLIKICPIIGIMRPF